VAESAARPDDTIGVRRTLPTPSATPVASAAADQVSSDHLPTGSGGGQNASFAVVLAEDHRIVREGTRQLLEHDPSIRVVGEASTGEEAVRLALDLKPSVMLVDIQLNGMNGIDVIRTVARTAPQVRCVVLSAYDDYVYITEAFEAGACGYLLKTVSAVELVGAVSAAAAGATVTDERISKRLMERWRSKRPLVERLTPRETDVLRLLVKGSSNKEIARALGVGLRTVEGYVSNIFAECGVRSRTEAVLFALSHNLATVAAAETDE
jgi:NarL family two-component system response regulator LiaR